MKGNAKLLVVLNQLLADELTAINQYMVHSEMCDNWGYGKLHKAIEGQAVDEMHHAVAAGTHLLWVISMSPNRRLTLPVGPLFFARRRVQWLLQRKRAWQQGHPLGVKRA